MEGTTNVTFSYRPHGAEPTTVRYSMRTYTATEVVRMLREAGFDRVETLRGLRRQPAHARLAARRRRVVTQLSDRTRDRFPILGETTYLINHSLGAMPAAAEERVAEYARTWRERGDPRLGRGLVDDAARGRRPDRPDRRRAARARSGCTRT